MNDYDFLSGILRIFTDSTLKVIQAFHTVRIVLYIGSRVSKQNQYDAMNDPITGPVTRYTELCVQYGKLEKLSKCSSLRFPTFVTLK